jgi:hypothetical protein
MIGYYQSLIAEQEKRKKRFNNLKSGLSGSVVPALNNTEDSLNKAATCLSGAFTVDGDTADGQSILNNASNVSDKVSTITGSVYGEIESEISKCNSKIASYNAKIQEILAELEKEESEG